MQCNFKAYSSRQTQGVTTCMYWRTVDLVVLFTYNIPSVHAWTIRRTHEKTNHPTCLKVLEVVSPWVRDNSDPKGPHLFTQQPKGLL